MTTTLKVPADRLDDGNDPILEHAAALLEADPAAPFVEFDVMYDRGDQPREERWSSPDRIRVDRTGNITPGEVSDAPTA